MNRQLLSRLGPYAAAIIIFLLATFLLFTPLFQGQQLIQSDITNFKGMSKEIQDYREKTGKEALWTNSMFGGMPAYQISVKYKANLMAYIDKIFRLGLPRPADYVFLYFLGFFFLLVIIGINPWLAIVGALAYGFSTYFIIILEAGHNTKAHAIAYMAPLLGSILLTLRGRWITGGILTALFAALEIYTNHLQITYYFLLTVLILWIGLLVAAIRQKQVLSFAKASSVLLLAALLAILPNITNLWTTFEYSKETTRGKTELSHKQEIQTSGLDKEYATQWSYGVAESWSLMIPNVKGGATDYLGKSEKALEKADPAMRKTLAQWNHYWGDQPFTSGPVYVGALIVFLFVLGLFLVKSSLKWSLLVATILSILLAWGRNFMPLTDFFLDHFPLYNKFRAVSMILVIAELTMPLLAILALWKTLNNRPQSVDDKKQFRNYLGIAYALTGGLSLLFYLMPGTFFSFLSAQEVQQFDEFRKQGTDPVQLNAFINSLEETRKAIFKADAIRSFFFITIGALLIYFYALGRKVNKGILIAGLGILVFVDLFFVNKRYINESNFESPRRIESFFAPTEADKFILKDTDPHFRVMNLTTNTFNDARTSYYHKSIGGYHGAKLKRYQELIEHQIAKNNMQVLNMLNAKYFILKGKDNQPVVQINMDALGNAWFVAGYRLVNNADEEMEALSNFLPAETAIIDKRFASNLQGVSITHDTTAQIHLTEYQPNKLVYEYVASKPQLAVFSEIYYPHGWQAYIDGQPVAHFRANYVLRAMVVPEGKHKIEFRFEPKSYYVGEKIALAGSLLLIFLFIGMLAFEIRKNFFTPKEKKS
ncbi:MAG: YfhO family protein [Bacteroidales bacterium]|mgnify:CR=1 FL=1|jgi:hypothetical protein|nr:YfhO family protein [Bacteroidales bacterium]NPV35413.1 YfhO family protein [Bacteroidales bacterium]